VGIGGHNNVMNLLVDAMENGPAHVAAITKDGSVQKYILDDGDRAVLSGIRNSIKTTLQDLRSPNNRRVIVINPSTARYYIIKGTTTGDRDVARFVQRSVAGNGHTSIDLFELRPELTHLVVNDEPRNFIRIYSSSYSGIISIFILKPGAGASAGGGGDAGGGGGDTRSTPTGGGVASAPITPPGGGDGDGSTESDDFNEDDDDDMTGHTAFARATGLLEAWRLAIADSFKPSDAIAIATIIPILETFAAPTAFLDMPLEHPTCEDGNIQIARFHRVLTAMLSGDDDFLRSVVERRLEMEPAKFAEFADARQRSLPALRVIMDTLMSANDLTAANDTAALYAVLTDNDALTPIAKRMRPKQQELDGHFYTKADGTVVPVTYREHNGTMTPTFIDMSGRSQWVRKTRYNKITKPNALNWGTPETKGGNFGRVVDGPRGPSVTSLRDELDGAINGGGASGGAGGGGDSYFNTPNTSL